MPYGSRAAPGSQNSGCLQDFIKALLAEGKSRFSIDFNACTGMDSTFLGVLAGVALQVRKLTPPGHLALLRIEGRNLELVRNLGLHRILAIESGAGGQPPVVAPQAIPCSNRSELENARVALQAHENLVEAEEANRSKFEDVLHFLASGSTRRSGRQRPDCGFCRDIRRLADGRFALLPDDKAG